MKKIISLMLIIISISVLYNYFDNILNNDKNITVIDKNKEEYDIELEEYIIGVVACEMPALYEKEALKAQAIASRTYALYQNVNNIKLLTTTSDQCYINENEMKEKWGDDFEIYYNKIKNVVLETKGIIMNKDNELFKSFYFSTSNGYTENSDYVFKEENLTSVSSPWDIDSKNYYREITYTKEELSNLLGEFEKIKIISRNDTNHVDKVRVDDKIYTGVEFRKILKLRSTDFNIEIEKNNYNISTYGYGHGVGMSQNGANELAKLGYDYKYILDYYYKNVEFNNYNV